MLECTAYANTCAVAGSHWQWQTRPGWAKGKVPVAAASALPVAADSDVELDMAVGASVVARAEPEAAAAPAVGGGRARLGARGVVRGCHSATGSGNASGEGPGFFRLGLLLYTMPLAVISLRFNLKLLA